MRTTTHKVSITIRPEYATLSNDFCGQLAIAIKAKVSSFTYNGTTFQLNYSSRPVALKVVLNDINAQLPGVFDGDNATVDSVDLRCEVPERLAAKPGRYLGKNFGLPGANCIVDPEGKTTNGKPTIYATGDIYPHVIELFKRVMAGELKPGCNDDPFSNTIYVSE